MKLNRWFYAVTGVLVLVFAGLVYAWSVLATPVAAYYTEWTGAQLSLTFTICMIFFCLGGLAAGLLSGKTNVKWNMAAAAILFLAGFFLASKAETVTVLYLGYGVLAGTAAGIAYNSVMSTVSGYFPDKPGLISGILLMGFGMGSFLIGKVYQAYTGPGEGFRSSFRVFGMILFVVMLVCSLFLRKPEPEEMKRFLPGGEKEGKSKIQEWDDFTASQMLGRRSFWLYFAWATLLSAAGLALISQASAVTLQVHPAAAAGTVSTSVGLISIFNGCGRVIFGGMFDRIGRKKTMVLIEVTYAAAMILLISSLKCENFVILICGFVVMGLAYGGVTPANSAFVSTFYGKKHYAVNFPMINLNLLIASFGSTIAGVLYDASGSYFSTFLFMLAAVAVGSVCETVIRKP